MKGKSVLIVDDEKNIRLMLSQAMEALELETETAVNGEEALDKLKEKEFNLILLDLKMPGMDGLDVLRQVRAIHPGIRVIIITAHGTIESAVEAMKLGAADFIQKPFAPREIRELVSQVINRETINAQNVRIMRCLLSSPKNSLGSNVSPTPSKASVKQLLSNPRVQRRLTFWGRFWKLRGIGLTRKSTTGRRLILILPTRLQGRTLTERQIGRREDNVNLMVAQVAQKIFRVPRVMARVFEPKRVF